VTKNKCYDCVHRLTIPGDAHTRCNNHDANVTGNKCGIEKGWFMWPLNFDPVWLEECDGFSDDPNEKKGKVKLDPLVELMAILK